MFSIKVFQRASLVELNTSFLMRVLAVADMSALNVIGWDGWLSSLTGSNIAYGSDIGCKIVSYITDVSVSYPGWVLCLITLERIIALALPLKVTEICSRKRSIILLILILLIICAVFIFGLFSNHSNVEFVFNDSNSHFEVKYNCYFNEYDWLYHWTSLLTRSFLPFTVLLISNIAILILFYQTLKCRRRLGVTADPGQLIFLTKLLMTNSLTYVLLTSPYVIYKVMPGWDGFTSKDEWRGHMELEIAVCDCLLYINHSINFFLYCLAGNKFRNEFRAMVRCIDNI